MDHQRVVADKGEKFIRNIFKLWLALQHRIGDAGDFNRLLANASFGVNIILKASACRFEVNQLKTANFDNAVALTRI